MNSRKSPLIQELESDSRWLISLSRRLLGTHEGAEDLVQDAAALALAEKRSSMERGQARAWLATTVKHLASNARRRRGTERHGRRDLGPDSGEGALAGGDPSPADILAKAEYRSRVAALVLKLPEAERQAILLRYYEGKRGREMQAALGAPSEAAVRQRISRGIAKLREQLDADRGTPGWRHGAVLMTSGAQFTPAPTKAVAAVLALAILGGSLAGARWIPSLIGESKGTSIRETAELDPVPIESVNPSSGPVLGTATGTETRRTLGLESPLADGAALAKFEVQILDGATGEPVAGQPWFIIKAGIHDFGRTVGMAGEVPNPEPLARGLTDDRGFAVAPLPEDELVNLCTDRSETHARGSWPISIRDGLAAPADVTLKEGCTIEGQVVDDEDAPIEGIEVYSYTFFDERVLYGITDADGRYRVPRCADFPRGFLVRNDDAIEAKRTLPTELGFVRPGAPEEDGLYRNAEGRLSVPVGEERVVTAPDVVISRFVSVSGRVVDARGRGIEGAFVTRTSVGAFSQTGQGKREVPPAATWSAPDFVLGQEQCFTQEDGRYAMKLLAPGRGRTQGLLAAYSPGGDLGRLGVSGMKPGASLEGLDFVMRDAETVRLRILLPPGNEGPEAGLGTAKLIWDRPNGESPDDPKSGTSLELSLAAEHVIEASAKGSYIVIPRAHQPDRQAMGGALSGTIFIAGFQPRHFELAPGTMEADLPLEALPSVRLRLEVAGEAAKWLKHASVTVTHEAPDPALSPEDQVKRYRQANLLRAQLSKWKNGEEHVVDLFGHRPAYAYVKLLGRGGRESRSLPPIGPIPVQVAGDEDIFVLRATVNDWPERAPESGSAAASEAPSAVRESRPSAIEARIVSDTDGSFLVNAKAVVLERPSNFRRQRIWKGEEREIDLAVVAPSASLRFSHPGYYSKDIGPISLAAGAGTDLGEVRLEPLRRIPCRLEGPDGAPVGPGFVVIRNDPEVGWAKMKADAEGRFDLYVGRDGPTPLVIRRGNAPKDPTCKAVVELLSDGSGRVAIPRWRAVRVRITGLEAPYCYAFRALRVEGPAELDGEEPNGASYFYPQLDGTDLIFSCHLPPGRWTILPLNSAFASFPPTALEVEPEPQGTDEKRGVQEITIRASLAL